MFVWKSSLFIDARKSAEKNMKTEFSHKVSREHHVTIMWPTQNMTNFFANNIVARGFLTPAYFMTVNIATPPL